MSFSTHAASCPLAPPYGFSRYQYAPQAGAPKGRYTIRSTKGQGTVADRVAGSALPSATRSERKVNNMV